MSRVSELPENALVEEIKTLERDLFELKTRQFMGYDVVKLKTSVTANASDKTVAGSSTDAITVDFTSDTQDRPSGSIRFDVWRGTIGTHAAAGSFELFVQDTTFASTPDNELEWFVNIQNNDVGNLIVKAYVIASDSGEVVVS